MRTAVWSLHDARLSCGVVDVAPAHRRRLRTRRGQRRLLWAVVVALAMLVWLATVAYGRAESSTRTIRVAPGDTLWSIAALHTDGADVRQEVDAIIAANHLPGPTVFPGEELVVPDG